MALSIDSFSLSPNPVEDGNSVDAVTVVSGGDLYQKSVEPPFYPTEWVGTGDATTTKIECSAFQTFKLSDSYPPAIDENIYKITLVVTGVVSTNFEYPLRFGKSSGADILLRFDRDSTTTEIRAIGDTSTNSIEVPNSDIDSNPVVIDVTIDVLNPTVGGAFDCDINVDVVCGSFVGNYSRIVEINLSDSESTRLDINNFGLGTVAITNFEIWNKVSSTPEYIYSYKKDAVEFHNSGTITDETYTYQFTPNISDNGASYTVDVTNAGNTVSSSPVILAVTSGTIDPTPIDSYTVNLSLAMRFRKGWNDTNVVFDWGSSADTYTTQCKYLVENFDIFARPDSNDSSIVLSGNGFLPFGTHFSGDQIGYRYPLYNGKANFHGDYHTYDVEMIPDSSGGYTYDTSVYVPCTVTGFTFGGIANIPMPECNPISEYSIRYNRAGNVIREYDRGETTEHRAFTIEWNNIRGEELRAILIQILTVIRGNSFNVNFADGFNRFSPWVPRDGETTTGDQLLRLSSGEIEYTYNGGNLWNLSIEVMKWQE
jgi:hypothetical protein